MFQYGQASAPAAKRYVGQKEMEPIRAIAIREVTAKGITVKPSEYVWLMGTPKDGKISIEYHNHQIDIPEDSIVSCPVPAPELSVLKALDECFGIPENHFTEIYKSEQYWFRLLQCKRHGKVFLEDTRGGAAIYSRLIFIADCTESPEVVWSRYHSMSDDWLNVQGIAY